MKKKQFSDYQVIKVGARDSKLSRAQVEEILRELLAFHPHVVFDPIWMKTTGDHDLKTSLKTLGKTDFFTKELDEKLLSRDIQIAIHSAKDLPDPLPSGLKVVALTRGVDPSDSLVFNEAELPQGARIGTSSQRREEMLLKWRPDLKCVDIRGTIDHRLSLLDRGDLEGLVVAEAALIRLKLTHRKRMPLDGDTAFLQGRLAVVARDDDAQMEELFSCLHVGLEVS